MEVTCSTIGFTRKPLPNALQDIADLGFRYVDLLMMENWAHLNPSQVVNNPEEHADYVQRLLKQNNLTATAINGNVSQAMNSTSFADIENNLRQAEGLIRFANALSIPVVVFQPGSSSIESFEKEISASIETLSEITSIADRYGVRIAIEAHINSLAERYQDALFFIESVPKLQIAYDPSHFVMGEYDLLESESLLPHTAHVHLRDAVAGNFQVPMGEGILDFEWIISALKRNNYIGTVAIEYIDHRGWDIVPDILALKQMLEGY